MEIEAKRLGGCVEDDAIDEERDFVGSWSHQSVLTLFLTPLGRRQPDRAFPGCAAQSWVNLTPTKHHPNVVRQGRKDLYFWQFKEAIFVPDGNRVVWTLRPCGPKQAGIRAECGDKYQKWPW